MVSQVPIRIGTSAPSFVERTHAGADTTPTANARSENWLLYVVRDFPIDSERFIEREVRALRSLGVSLRIAVMDPRGGARREVKDFPLIRVPSPRSPRLWWAAMRAMMMRPRAIPRQLGLALSLGSERQSLRVLRKLRWLAAAAYLERQLADDPPTVIHAHFGSSPTTLALLLASALHRRVGFSVHARDFYARFSGDSLERKVREANYVVACSEVLVEDLQRALPETLRARVHLAHHGIDLEHWAVNLRASAIDAPLRVVGVGRFEPKKGFELLIEACSLLAADRFPIFCELIGEGREEQRLRDEIASCGVGDCVKIVPWCEPDALRRRYAEADVLVIPSRIAQDGDRDNLPNVMIEAMAVGLPVVAAALPAIANAVRAARACLLFPPGDANALANAMRDVTSPAISRELSIQGRQLVEAQWDVRKTAPQTRSLIFGEHGPESERAVESR